MDDSSAEFFNLMSDTSNRIEPQGWNVLPIDVKLDQHNQSQVLNELLNLDLNIGNNNSIIWNAPSLEVEENQGRKKKSKNAIKQEEYRKREKKRLENLKITLDKKDETIKNLKIQLEETEKKVQEKDSLMKESTEKIERLQSEKDLMIKNFELKEENYNLRLDLQNQVILTMQYYILSPPHDYSISDSSCYRSKY